MRTGGIWLTFAMVCIGISVIIALLFRFWPRYGSVNAAVERSDRFLEQMEATHTQP
jgi:cytochrome c biogenesis protein ResB